MAPQHAARGSAATDTVSADSPVSLGREPKAGLVISVIVSLAAIAILAIFLTQRFLTVKVWGRLPYVVWLVFSIYVDSFLFVYATAILQFGFGVDSGETVCGAAIILCLACYVTTKLIYLFLVEKAYAIRATKKRRMQSKLYIFNSFGMIGVYIIVAILQFLFRFTRLENGQCIIGMKKFAMIPLISFDALVNVYLTILFLIPLSGLYSFQSRQKTSSNARLRTIATRTFIGSVCTLASSIVNLTVLMVLDGEPGWVCLMCCNLDILFSAVVVQWVTSKDHAGSTSNTELHVTDDNVTSGRRQSSGRAPTPISAYKATGAPRSFSPMATKPVMEDVVEISLGGGSRRFGSSENTLCVADETKLVLDRLPSPPPPVRYEGKGGRGSVKGHRGFEEISPLEDDRFDVSLPPVREGWPTESS